MLPCLTMEGKILMEDKHKIAVASESNRDIYHALHKKGVINSLKERGILYSHCYDVDNCLAKVADPIFIGYSVAKNTDCGVKVVTKAISEERVGAVECSRISKEVFEMRSPDGTLAFGTANIVNQFFSTDFLERILTSSHELEYHIARKKIKHIDLESGEIIAPNANNGLMMEFFTFGVFPFTRNLTVLEVDRKEEFSLLKDIPQSATNCPETPRRDLLAQRLRAFQAASGKGTRRDRNEALEVKVSPLVSIWW
jgi:UDP-N-acetylglucosamine/UDP-N-acetylgalactosamine diphosphorylase